MKNIFLFVFLNLISLPLFAKSHDAFCTANSRLDQLHNYQISFKLGWSGGWLHSHAYVMYDFKPVENGRLTCDWDYSISFDKVAAYHCYEPGKKELYLGLKAAIIPIKNSPDIYSYHAILYRGNMQNTLGILICTNMD